MRYQVPFDEDVALKRAIAIPNNQKKRFIVNPVNNWT
jgi:hypothetical protein